MDEPNERGSEVVVRQTPLGQIAEPEPETPIERQMNEAGFRVRKSKRHIAFTDIVKEETKMPDRDTLMHIDFLQSLMNEYQEPNLFAEKLRRVERFFVKRLTSKSWMKWPFLEIVVLSLNKLCESGSSAYWQKMLKQPLNDFILNQIIRLKASSRLNASALEFLQTCPLLHRNERFDTVMIKRKLADDMRRNDLPANEPTESNHKQLTHVVPIDLRSRTERGNFEAVHKPTAHS